MENPVNTNTVATQTEKLTLLLKEKYTAILEKSDLLDEMYWDIEKEGINSYIIKGIEDLVVSLQSNFNSVVISENEFVYPEMKNVMPDPDIAESFIKDNNNILMLANNLWILLKNKDIARKEKDLLQAEMIETVDLIQRNIKNKEDVFFHQFYALLTDDKLDIINKKIELSLGFSGNNNPG